MIDTYKLVDLTVNLHPFFTFGSKRKEALGNRANDIIADSPAVHILNKGTKMG